MIIAYKGKFPKLHPSVFVHPMSSVIGEVEIGACSSVWPGASIRGDMQPIRIGEKVSIQDGCVLHEDKNLSPLILGSEITLGHRCVLHGCRIGNLCLIGMGSIVMDNSEIGDGCIIAAGSVVVHGTKIPAHTLALGIPAKPKREITQADLDMIKSGVEDYCRLAAEYREYSANPYSLKEK